MKPIVTASVAGLLLVIWNTVRRRETPQQATDRLRDAIEASNLPPRARQEVRELLDQQRTRPSQFGETDRR